MWKVTKTHHLGLTVTDIEQSIRFYEDNFGMKLISRREADADYVGLQTGYPGVRLDVASLKIAPDSDQLLQMAQYLNYAGEKSDQTSNRAGNTHLCLIVDDIHEAYEELSGKGVSFKSEPIEITAGPNKGGYGVYLFDLDGYTIELHEPRRNKERS